MTSDAARFAREAAARLGAAFEDLDGGSGYLFRVTRGARSVLAGAGAIPSFPVNGAVPVALARDKAHAKTVLTAAGVQVIPGGLFFAHTRRIALREPGREAADALAYADRLGFPVFCKPNTGARGNFAEIIASRGELADYILRLADAFEAFLVEPVIAGVEHRVLVQDGRPIFHSVKRPPRLAGDGRSSARALLDALNARLIPEGLSPYPPAVLALSGHAAEDIPEEGAHLPVLARRNLSTSGSAEHVSLETPPALAALAIRAVAALGLRIGAVDLFDVSAAKDLSELLVIEVNGNPGLQTLERTGRRDVIDAIWTRMLEELLGPQGGEAR